MKSENVRQLLDKYSPVTTPQKIYGLLKNSQYHCVLFKASLYPSLNGVLFEITDLTGELTGALMKEVMYYDSVYLLYRLDTSRGSLAGYYDTKDKFLFSITQEAISKIPYNNLTALILSMYASQVLTGTNTVNCDNKFFQNDFPIQIKAYSKGGKLQNQYNTDHKSKTARNLDEYDKEERYINVIIRKFPEGRQASEEAKQLAEQYGYDLEPGQTFREAIHKASVCEEG